MNKEQVRALIQRGGTVLKTNGRLLKEKMSLEGIVILFFLLLLIALLGWLIPSVTLSSSGSGECAEHGFPEASVRMWYDVTCFRIEDGSTVARPLDWVKSNLMSSGDAIG